MISFAFKGRLIFWFIGMFIVYWPFSSFTIFSCGNKLCSFGNQGSENLDRGALFECRR